MEQSDTFYIDIDGKKVLAEILVVFTFYGNTYCAYSIKNKDNGLNDVYSAKIVDNVLVNIHDEKEKQFTKNALETLYYDLFNDQESSYAHYMHDISPDLQKVSSIIHYDLTDGLYDTTIIHEHMHAASLFAKRVDDKHAIGGTGFLKSKQLKGVMGDNVEDDYSNFALVDLDELFTEYFAMLISEKMREDNCCFTYPEDEFYSSVYRTSFPAMKVFFDNFLPQAKTFYINHLSGF